MLVFLVMHPAVPLKVGKQVSAQFRQDGCYQFGDRTHLVLELREDQDKTLPSLGAHDPTNRLAELVVHEAVELEATAPPGHVYRWSHHGLELQVCLMTAEEFFEEVHRSPHLRFGAMIARDLNVLPRKDGQE